MAAKDNVDVKAVSAAADVQKDDTDADTVEGEIGSDEVKPTPAKVSTDSKVKEGTAAPKVEVKKVTAPAAKTAAKGTSKAGLLAEAEFVAAKTDFEDAEMAAEKDVEDLDSALDESAAAPVSESKRSKSFLSSVYDREPAQAAAPQQSNAFLFKFLQAAKSRGWFA